jgi:hypothetical protein
MRAIISAIISVFKTVVGLSAAIVSAPFRLLFGGGGSRGREPIPEVAQEFEIPPAPGPDYTEMYRQIAIQMQAWAVESLLADEIKPVPTKWPRDVKEWAKGLSREECFVLIDAPERAVVGHISGVFDMPRVRKVGPLPATAWEALEPHYDPCAISPGFRSAPQLLSLPDDHVAAEALDLRPQLRVLLRDLDHSDALLGAHQLGEPQHGTHLTLFPGVIVGFAGRAVVRDAGRERAGDRERAADGACGECALIERRVRAANHRHREVSR